MKMESTRHNVTTGRSKGRYRAMHLFQRKTIYLPMMPVAELRRRTLGTTMRPSCALFVAGCGNISGDMPPLPGRIGIAVSDWLPLVTGFGRLFHRVAGAPRSIERLKSRRRFRAGRAALLGAS